ncbi:D-alanyl-D-alanine carboxypeptidase [Clostridium neonatale]|uniref:serine-type D-Ala-D-Ala carboxypeptidase n=1 Tax=Clostridium neonatale TaxID=137838 RepID=A0A2A7MH01_9CLOT|nr:D-alanyl-D-alanine carboxypeptidase family protein [Clostridium neonatale]PEG27273.1 D-alanyl-D-alanine carboxypeptidase [Clostridium neonatale]PEG30879.1 D-alanyl-D-alanine carboxypeptidase [Clostridium neonatale]CAI3241555.1 putative peptidase, S11 family [Clostridium neonatale]CAI3588447.1 putative peptidase, S11 family [Clostridium neonatale]
MIKKIKYLVILLFLFCRPVYGETIIPEINAQGYAVIDAESGQVLFGKDIDTKFEPASTTKVITALIVLEKSDLYEEVTIRENFTDIDGSAIGLLKGDVVTVYDLLLGLMLESGNDCANALAYHVSGSIEEFAELMNEKARELGAIDTNFKNPSGLPDEEHYTTPRDLALFLREAIKNTDFINIATTENKTISMINNSERTLTVNNKNYLINKNSEFYYEYALCGKSGYTMRANHTFLAAAKKDGNTLIGSFLKASDKEQNYKDMKSIFNYGFNNYSFIDLYNTNEKVATYYITNNERIPLFVNETIKYVTEKGNEDNLNYNLKIKDDDLSNKSFKKGEKILDGTIYVNNQEYIDVDLYAGESRDLRISSESSSDITKTTHKEEVNENKEEKNDRSNFAKIGILGIMVFIALRIRRKIILKRIKRKKMLMRKKKIMRNINKRKI